jgi:(p)ppGpp synthase/HD superfamily hydrolase
MKMFDKCLRIAEEAHAGQKRKFTGEEYISHPLAVSNKFSDEDYKCVSILHDVIEDTYISSNDLLEQGIPEEIVDEVSILTKIRTETYCNYIKRVKTDKMATIIKIADINHNLSNLSQGTLRDKYELAKEILEK